MRSTCGEAIATTAAIERQRGRRLPLQRVTFAVVAFAHQGRPAMRAVEQRDAGVAVAGHVGPVAASADGDDARGQRDGVAWMTTNAATAAARMISMTMSMKVSSGWRLRHRPVDAPAIHIQCPAACAAIALSAPPMARIGPASMPSA